MFSTPLRGAAYALRDRLAALKGEKISAGGKMVVAMLKAEPNGLRSSELFRRSEIEFPEKPFPVPPPPPQRFGKKGVPLENPPQVPRPGHAIESTSFLKKSILADLERRNVIKKVHMARDPTEEETEIVKARTKRLTRRKHRMMLEGRDVVTHVKTKVDEWKWILLPEEVHNKPVFTPPVPPGVLPKGKMPYMPGEYDHLNTRRQRKRMEGLTKEQQLLEDIKVAQEEAARSQMRSRRGGADLSR